MDKEYKAGNDFILIMLTMIAFGTVVGVIAANEKFRAAHGCSLYAVATDECMTVEKLERETKKGIEYGRMLQMRDDPYASKKVVENNNPAPSLISRLNAARKMGPQS